jgi:hypothetical protein
MAEAAAAAQKRIDAAAEADDRRAREEAAHKKHLSDLTAAQVAEHAGRVKELQRLQGGLETTKREIAAEGERLTVRLRDIENRSADLSNRLHSIGAG